jgi:hypothetical protein
VYLALIFNPDEPNAFFCLQSVETPATDLIIRMNFIDGAHSNNATDAGLLTLVTMLRFLGIGADPEQIRHRFGGTPIGIPQMLRVAPEFGLKTRARKTTWSRLPNSPLPAIAPLHQRLAVTDLAEQQEAAVAQRHDPWQRRLDKPFPVGQARSRLEAQLLGTAQHFGNADYPSAEAMTDLLGIGAESMKTQ